MALDHPDLQQNQLEMRGPPDGLGTYYYYYYYHYAAFNAPCVGHKDDESQAQKINKYIFKNVIKIVVRLGLG